MQVVRLSIKNFRSIQSAQFYPGMLNLLVGENNAGKSTVLEALNLCLGEATRAAGEVAAYDFYEGKFHEPDGSPRVVTAEVVLSDLDAETRATFRDALELWDAEEMDVVETADAAGRIEGDQKRWCVRVTYEAQYDSALQDIVARRFFPKFGREENESSYREVRTHERRAFGFFFVPCVRDAQQGFSLGRYGLLGTLLRANKVSLTDFLVKLREGVQADAAFKTLRDNENYQAALGPVKDRMKSLLHGQAPDGLDFELRLTDVSGRELLNAIQILLKPAGGLDIPLLLQGHGTQQAALLGLYLALGARRGIRILAVEEPETGLHPGLARAMANQLIRTKSQLFATTHSPVICQRFKAEHVWLVTKRSTDGHSHQFTSLLPPESAPGISNRDNLRRIAEGCSIAQPLDFAAMTFSRYVLVVEGKTEQQWLHLLLALACEKRPDCSNLLDADSLGISIFRSSSHGETDKVSHLCRQHYGKKAIILVDGDVPAEQRTAKLSRCEFLIRLPDRWAIERLFLSGLPEADLAAFAAAIGMTEASPKIGAMAKELKSNAEYDRLLSWPGYEASTVVAELVKTLNRFVGGDVSLVGKEVDLGAESGTA